MSWLSRIVALVRRDDPSRSAIWWPGVGESGIYVTQDVALQLSAVWACVDAITKALSSSPWCVFGVDGVRRTPLPDDPLHYVLNTRANPEAPAIAVRESLLYQCLTNGGNGYAEIQRDGAGRVVALWPLDASRMYVSRDSLSGELVYEWSIQDGSRFRIPTGNVFHLRGPSVNGLMGDNLVSRAARVLGIAAAADRFAGAFFGNGATVGTVIEMQKALDKATYDRLRASWQEWRQGSANSHKPIIVEAGTKISDLGAKPQETQLLDTRKFSVLEICRYFGVPPHIVGDLERATFSNIEAQQIDWVTRGLTPWARRLEQEANYKLFPQRVPWRETTIDLQWLMRGDQKSRWESYQIARRIGVYSANDILEKEGENPIGEEGDLRIVEKNMVLLDEESLTPPPPAPAAPPSGTASAREDEEGGGADEDEGEDEGMGIARAAAEIIVGGALERYANRLKNRAADLAAKHPAEVVTEKLGKERVKALARLREEVAAAVPFLERIGATLPNGELPAFACRVESGERAGLVASLLLSDLSARPARMEPA